MSTEEYIKLATERNLSMQNLIVMYQLIVNGVFTKQGFDKYIEALDKHHALAHYCDDALKSILKEANPYNLIDLY